MSDSRQDNSRQLWCLIEGESNVFPVTVNLRSAVGNLKTVIQSERALDTLKEVGAHTLELWKPKDSNPIAAKPADTLVERISYLGDGLSKFADRLDPTDMLFTIFSMLPPSDPVCINIIVKAPVTANETRNISPTQHTLSYETIKVQIDAELALLQPTVEAFLKDPELPTWVPPDHAAPNIREFITGLRIPTYPNGKPSLLFHDLEMCDGEEIRRIFGDVTHMYICNTSGSGKTRRIMEGLTKYWGFYLVAAPDVNRVGLPDLRDALQLAADNSEWVTDLHDIPPEKRATQSDVNRRIVSRVLRIVLAARIVVFDLFLQLAVQVDGCLQEKHKRIWLLFQMFDPRDGGPHPFSTIFKKVRHASDAALTVLVDHLDEIIRILPNRRFILGLDEVQRATTLYPYSGISVSKPSVFRSVLRDMVNVFVTMPVKLVVSGTSLSLADLEGSMASGVSKLYQEVEVFHELGMFDTWEKLTNFFGRYVPASFLENPSGYHLQQRMREYLLGRYRFSVSFLECFLMNGLQSPHKLLNKYLEGHITCPPGDIGDPFTSDEPDPFIDIKVKGFEWDKLQLDSSAIQEAITIVQSHLTKGQSPTYGPVTARLVEYGIARLREGHKGHIIEPLAFLSLMMWLSNANLQHLADIRAGDAHSRGYAFEEAMILKSYDIQSP